MTITPHFHIAAQSDTQLMLNIHVPHVRFNVEEIQISLTNDSSTFHFYCPPIYLLLLHFAPYQFQEEEDVEEMNDADAIVEEEEEKEQLDTVKYCHRQSETNQNKDENENDGSVNITNATTATKLRHNQSHHAKFLPHVQNGMIQITLQKHVQHQYHWEHLDFLGKLQQPPPRHTTVSNHKPTANTTTVNRISCTDDIWAAAAVTPTCTAQRNWLHEIINEPKDDDDDAVGENDEHNDDTADRHQQQQQHQDLPTNLPTTTTTTSLPDVSFPNRTPPSSDSSYYTGTYGFHRMFANIYNDVQRENSLATQMLECPWPLHRNMTTNRNLPFVVDSVNDIQNIDNHHHSCGSITQIQQQRQYQRKNEYEIPKFNIERYIQDIDIEECQDFIHDNARTALPHWKQQQSSSSSSLSTPMQQQIATDPRSDVDETSPNENTMRPSEQYFTSTERQSFMSIPYPLLDDISILQPPPPLISSSATVDEENHQMHHHRQQQQQQVQLALCIGLMDILYAYVYDHLTTIDQEPTVESAWTISTLSISLSWLHDWLPTDNDDDDDVNAETGRNGMEEMVQSVMQSSIRRSLIYPYIRNFSFSIYIWEQVVSILQNTNYDSIRVILRCLLQVRNILNYSDIYYLGNKLYIDPYLIWIQKYSDTNYLQDQFLLPIAQCMQRHMQNETRLQELKHSVGLNLLQIEVEFYNDVNFVVEDEEEAVVQDNTSESDETGNSEDNESSDDDDGDDDDEGGDSSSCSSSRPESVGVGSADPLVEPRPSEAFDNVEAATRGMQRLEIIPNGPNTDSHSTSPMTAKASTLEDLLNICTKPESLKTEVNKSGPLIQEIN